VKGGDVTGYLSNPLTAAVALAGLVGALAVAAPSGAATSGSGCPAADTWTAVDFVYSGNYRKTGLYEWAWVTNPALGAAVQAEFGLSERDAYFFGVESFGSQDKNGNQVLCVSYLGVNHGQEDYILSVVDDNSNS
jgi:hypothetical protein